MDLLMSIECGDRCGRRSWNYVTYFLWSQLISRFRDNGRKCCSRRHSCYYTIAWYWWLSFLFVSFYWTCHCTWFRAFTRWLFRLLLLYYSIIIITFPCMFSTQWQFVAYIKHGNTTLWIIRKFGGAWKEQVLIAVTRDVQVTVGCHSERIIDAWRKTAFFRWWPETK